MKKLFLDTRILDSSCRRKFHLSEEVMMENAACGLERYLLERTNQQLKGKKVLILCGGGNNGADGYALARRITGNCELKVVAVKKASSELCVLQAERFSFCGGTVTGISDFIEENFSNFDFVIDCVFGSGFHGEFDSQTEAFFEKINLTGGTKIACDMPSGLSNEGNVAKNSFCADVTVSMGAYKLGFFSDEAKDITGEIKICNLGVSENLFEIESDYNLLEENDFNPPVRKKQNQHKGKFGHCAVISGEKIGASCIAGSAALNFGCGLVSLVNFSSFENSSQNFFKVPVSLMMNEKMPENVTSVVFGPGFGRDKNASVYFEWLLNHPETGCVLDADAFYYEEIFDFLKQRSEGIILTPHPKEFLNLLKICGLVGDDMTVSECVQYRINLVELFCREFPGVVLLLKGANTITGVFGNRCGKDFDLSFKLFVNPFGTNALAKAGSGDVLSGLCGALLAQGKSSLESAINGTMAHGLASRKIKDNYSLTPEKLIELTGEL